MVVDYDRLFKELIQTSVSFRKYVRTYWLFVFVGVAEIFVFSYLKECVYVLDILGWC